MNLWPVISLTLQLAAITTVILMTLALPLAWWLATTQSRVRPVIEAITALPLVLPPTVLGFYLLILMSPQSALGSFWVRMRGESLTFSFTGLVIASLFYSLPFAVQPLQTALMAVPQATVDAARTLGASARDAFFSISLPLARRGFLTAAVLTFAHTIGEFGVVLMVGGNIPGKTRVISIEIFTAVETLDYGTAHVLSAGLLIFSFGVLTLVYALNRKGGARLG
ncbi:MAG: molybdate ABC transporter permease subunit [Paracoccaceae bacterium]|nr:molybdate ABC transporter permease subunit [Paracoccaceae bacterium]